MRKTDEQKKAALQQRVAVLKGKIRRIEKHEVEAERRVRNHRLIVIGAIAEEMILAAPKSGFADAFMRALADYLALHPRDHDCFADLLERLTAPSTDAQEAEQREAAE